MFLCEMAMYPETTLAIEVKASLPVIPYNGFLIQSKISSWCRLVLTFAGLYVIPIFLSYA